jgi:hypothetical protein
MEEKVMVEITRSKCPDGWNYYLIVSKFYLGVWMAIDYKQKEDIKSMKRANEVKKELLEHYKE